MADCTDYPTPEDVKRFKNNANSVNEFVTSDSDTLVDQDGGEHITIEGIGQLAENQRDQFNATFQAQFAYKRIGNISDYVGNSLPETDKLNSYQFPDDSGDWYGPLQNQSFPIVIPADPSNDDGWALVSALTKLEADSAYLSISDAQSDYLQIENLSDYSTINYNDELGNSAIHNMIAGAKIGEKCSSGFGVWKRVSDSGGDLSDFISLNGVWAADFGVQPTDTYDSTSELQNCIDSVSENSTVHIEHPCSFGKITVDKSLNIKGYRPNKQTALIKLVGLNAGFVSSGRIIELNYESLYYECDGNLSNRQIPQSVGASSDIDEISYKKCYAKNCVIGFSMAFESGRVLRKKGLIEDCEVDTTVGVDPGEGYGLHAANDRQVNGYKSKITINRNLVDKATRHSIYASRSGGYTITNNHVKNHRMATFDGNARPAMLVGRASDTVGYGNTYEDCYGVCLAIVPETVDAVTYDCSSVHFSDETFINPKELAPVSFGLLVRKGGDIIGASVRNSSFKMNDNSIPLLLSYYGFDLNFQGNDAVYRGVGAVDLFVMVGVDESNYSTLHSDRWDFSRNNIDIYSKTGTITSYKITQNIGARINLDNEITGGDTTLTMVDPAMTQNRITLNGVRFMSVGVSTPVGNIAPYKVSEKLVLQAPNPDTVWLATGDTNADWIQLG